MRKPFVAGNWKMFKTVADARHLVSELIPALQPLDSVDRVLCPPFTALLPVAALLEGSGIGLGAQNMYWEDSGAYTGEIAPPMLAEFCQYVILGHSERRQYFGETDETVNRKVQAALAHRLVPIVCVGETLAEYEAGRTADVVFRQVKSGLAGLSISNGEGLVVAYEPVWAIGTGKASTAPDANKVIADVIRPAMAEVLGAEMGMLVRVLYGGSVKSSNAAEFFSQPDIDGALVGGASLMVGEFKGIVQAAAG
jgi:triosephosphate isomerase (TIM)